MKINDSSAFTKAGFGNNLSRMIIVDKSAAAAAIANAILTNQTRGSVEIVDL